jgi:hypothetical protein
VATGLILLAFLGALVTWLFTKARRRMGLGVTSRHWVISFAAVTLIILVIWANGHT